MRADVTFAVERTRQKNRASSSLKPSVLILTRNNPEIIEEHILECSEIIHEHALEAHPSVDLLADLDLFRSFIASLLRLLSKN